MSRSPKLSRAEFGHFVDDAAIQRKFMAPWHEDRKMEKDGWKTLYAVDADIFRFYGLPSQLARRDGARRGYAEVFRLDDEIGTFALANRLADYIFFELTGDEPLLIIEPINGEINRIMTALTLQLGKEPVYSAKDPERTAEVVRRLTRIPENEEIPLDVLTTFTRLVELRGPSGSQTTYLRLCQLLEARRVSTMDALDIQSATLRLIQSVANPVRDILSIVQHSAYASKWHDLLVTAAPPSRRHSLSTLFDAQALARLQDLNSKLHSQRTRILYITGSAHVIEAAENFREGDGSFLDAYIRHPRYFLASPDVVAPISFSYSTGASSASEFSNWITTFLAEIDSSGFPYPGRRSIRSIAEAAFDRDNTLGDTLKDRWEAHLATLAASYVPPEIAREMLIASSSEDEKRGFVHWEQVRQQFELRIEAALDEAWDACFRSATQTGFFVGAAVISSPSRPEAARFVPPLRFDGWKATDAFVRLLAQWRNAQDINREFYKQSLSAVKDETGEDYYYAYYLAHAALFAARGNWRIGEVLAKRALTRTAVDASYNDRAGHGREASFLAAHCRRYTAKAEKDLHEAELLLSAAVELFEKEVEERPYIKVVPERFKTEKLAIDLTRKLFGLFSDDHITPTESIVSTAQRDSFYRDTLEGFYNIRDVMLSQYRSVAPEDLSLFTVVASEVMRINSNILFLSILLNEFDRFEQDNIVSEFIDSDRLSYYRRVLIDVYCVVRTRDKKRYRQLQSKFSSSQIHVNKVLPYDVRRFEFLRDLARIAMIKSELR